MLVEHRRPGADHMSGFTDNYLKVNMPLDTSLANKIVNVRITGGNGEEMTGEYVG